MKRLMLLLLFITGTSLVDAQTALFVSSTGNDSNNGQSWETAKATLSGALAEVSGNTHIYMCVGTYSCQNVTIPNGVTVTGGYASASTGTDTTQRLFPGTNPNWTNTSLCTILNGGNTARVATVNTGGKLEGCIIQNGKVSDKGGGVLIDGGTVLHCVIIYNSALDEANRSAKGGGVYVQNNGSLLNCVVAYNLADNGAGVAGTDGILTNNTITANHTIFIVSCGTVTDCDGNTYSTVLIGDQCWMRENLRVGHYPDGSTVPNMYGSTTGNLYRWTPAAQSVSSTAIPSGVRGVCPTGWHLPSLPEWQLLFDFLQNDNAYWCGNSSTSIAKSLATTSGWTNSAISCHVGNQSYLNNISGFNAFPDGYRDVYGYGGGNGNTARFWTATSGAYVSINYDNTSVNVETGVNNNYNFSVRCLRD